MALKIIGADERLAERNGPKILISGVPKIGKTSLLRTLSQSALDRTLFVAIEPGEAAILDVRVDTVRPETWGECRDIAALLSGPDPSLGDEYPYSQAHYDAVACAADAINITKYDHYFIDSISAASRMSMAHTKQQPEAVSEKTGKANTMGLYGEHGRQMVAWFNQIQRARAKAVTFLCILDKNKDEFGRVDWDFQIDGGMAGKALAGIVDNLVVMADVLRTDAEAPERLFVCKSPNPEKYPAGDRTGRLDLLEPADLGALLAKLTQPTPAVAIAAE